MIIKILLSSILCFYAISPAFCFVPSDDDDTSGSESVSKRARVDLEPEKFLLEDMALTILKNKTDLRSINLCRENNTDDDDLTDSDLEVIANLFPKLVSIDLVGRKVITDVGLQAIAKGCPNLTKIDLYSCRGITD